jgi:hypothetical protein
MVVWEAYKRVKANGGAAGVDSESIEEFEKNLKNNLYKLWNRMSSGTYFPPPVRSVAIPKKDGAIGVWAYRPFRIGSPRRSSRCTWNRTWSLISTPTPMGTRVRGPTERGATRPHASRRGGYRPCCRCCRYRPRERPIAREPRRLLRVRSPRRSPRRGARWPGASSPTHAPPRDSRVEELGRPCATSVIAFATAVIVSSWPGSARRRRWSDRPTPGVARLG